MHGYSNPSKVECEIEEAFRFGNKSKDRPRQILTRFYSTEKRNEVMAKSKG